MSHFPPSLLLLFYLPLPFFLVVYIHFVFFQVIRWCVLPVVWCLDINALTFPFTIVSFLPAFLTFFYITSEFLWSCSMSDAIADNCPTGIHTVYRRVRGEVLSACAMRCNVHWVRLSITSAWYWWYWGILSISVVGYWWYWAILIIPVSGYWYY